MERLCLVAVFFLVTAMPASAATGRAVSLNAAAAAVKSGHAQDVRTLCGITRVSGYVVDETNRDVVVFGEADPTLPAQHLDDFAVALRNANLLYVQTKGRTRYYSAPGCSIDPNPETMRSLRSIGNVDLNNEEQVQAYLDKWNEIGRRPQNVRVMGVPFDSRFAKVMVDADYYMKRLVNGSVELDIEGFASLSVLTVDQIKKAYSSGKTQGLGGYTMNRFWFSPGEATYSEQDGAVMLKSCKVQLLTEEEYMTEHGIAGKGRANSLAKQFSTSFSKHYSEIAERRPIYTELEGLFRLAGIARILRDQGAKSPGLEYLLKSYKVEVVPVSRQVLGLTSNREINEERETPQGRSTFRMIIPNCGGVSMDVRPKRIGTPAPRKTSASAPRPGAKSPAATAPKAKTPTRPAAPSLKRAVLSSRQSEKTLSWDFELPTDK